MLKFYIYAGYYELYITTEHLDEPLVYLTEFDTIEQALNYCDEQDDCTIYCDNVKDYLPDYLYDYLQEHDYEYYKPKAA